MTAAAFEPAKGAKVSEFTVPAGETLKLEGTNVTIPSGVALKNEGTVENRGTIQNQGKLGKHGQRQTGEYW